MASSRTSRDDAGRALGESDWVRAAERRSLGFAIRSLRQKQNRTLAGVAGPAGISVSLLSQVERGLVAPSLDSLRNIAEALDTTPFRLLADKQPRALVVRSGAGVDLDVPDFLEFRLLSPSLEGAFEVGRWTLPPGGVSAREARSHSGEEANYILSGQARLQIGADVYDVEAGDLITFDGRLPHRCECIGDAPVSAIFIVCPPSF